MSTTQKANACSSTFTKVKCTLSVLQIYWKYTSKVYLKYTSSILKAHLTPCLVVAVQPCME